MMLRRYACYAMLMARSRCRMLRRLFTMLAGAGAAATSARRSLMPVAARDAAQTSLYADMPIR